MVQHKTYIQPVFICMAAVAAMLFYSCTNDLEKIRMDVGDKIPTAITRDFIALYSDSGVVTLQMEAPLRNDYAGEEFYSEMPNGIKVTFFGKNREVIARLSANYALMRGSYMYIEGDVKMYNKENGSLTTRSLLWNSHDKTIVTDDDIVIRQKNRMLLGQGLWALQDFSNYKILVPSGNVSVRDN